MRIRLTHNGRQRDSLLMPMGASRTMDLMLQFRLRLVRCEPTSHFNVGGTRCRGDGILRDEYGRFHLDTWTDTEWTAYRNAIVGVITRYWDGKFELTPNHPWHRPFGPAGAVEATPVTCSLSLGLVETNPHHTYYIIKPRESNFRSFASMERRYGLFTHRDLSLDWNTRMTRIGRSRHSVSFLQNTVLHEFGHTLGLNHVNGSGNGDSNYGVTLDQRHDLMGLGDHVTAREARPWKSQLRHHLIPEHGAADRALRFTARVVSPQLITYWDNDWRPAVPAH